MLKHSGKYVPRSHTRPGTKEGSDLRLCPAVQSRLRPETAHVIFYSFFQQILPEFLVIFSAPCGHLIDPGDPVRAWITPIVGCDGSLPQRLELARQLNLG